MEVATVASPSTEARDQGREVASTAVDQARDVGRSAQGAAHSVAGDVREEVGQVAGELRQQARTMVDETRTHLRDKADAQTAGLADRVGQLAEELRALANGHPEQAATARKYLDQAGSTVADVAGQLRDKDFEGVVRDVQRFARRRPGAFLAASAAVGFLAGRLVRSAKDDAEPSSPSSTSGNGAAQEQGRAVPPAAGLAGNPNPAAGVPGGGRV
jgi:ElaB/YqjD/DUF883 family membrane-anchored ribosome-binding protein